MDKVEREIKVVELQLNKEPAIAQWLWAMQDARARTMRELEGVTPAMISWLSPEDAQYEESTIGTILYHLADIEADWLYVEVLEQPLPSEVSALFSHPTRDRQGRLTQIEGYSLQEHVKRLDTVRGLLLDAFQPMELSEFRRVRSLEYYDVTPEWVLHHLMQHEAEHRSQIGALRIKAERALTSSNP